MKGNGFRLLKTDIQQEVENLRHLQQELEELLPNFKDHPSRVELRALGSILHDSVLKTICKNSMNTSTH